jgi:hypothetical protein
MLVRWDGNYSVAPLLEIIKQGEEEENGRKGEKGEKRGGKKGEKREKLFYCVE